MKKSCIIIIFFVFTSTFSFNKEVKVKSVKEFFEALDSNTEIIVQCETLNFTLEYLEKELNIENYEEHWVFDTQLKKRIPKSYFLSGGIILYGYENLIIRSENHTDIVSENESDDILSFKNCKGLVLEGFSVYHTPKTCNGAVLSIFLSEDIKVNNCALNGSGGYGANLIGANNVQFNTVAIFNNVFHAVNAINSNNIRFNKCDIFDNHEWGESLIYTDVSDLSFKKCKITDNQSQHLIFSYQDVILNTDFKNCVIERNVFDFNLENYNHNHKKSKRTKKDKKELLLKLFMDFFKNQITSDYDSRNIEFQSFFTNKYMILYKNQTRFVDFISLYFSLKKKDFKIDDFSISDDKVTINKNMEHPETWRFYFNKKNKIERIEII